jgi:hypothetical protein
VLRDLLALLPPIAVMCCGKPFQAENRDGEAAGEILGTGVDSATIERAIVAGRLSVVDFVDDEVGPGIAASYPIPVRLGGSRPAEPLPP